MIGSYGVVTLGKWLSFVREFSHTARMNERPCRQNIFSALTMGTPRNTHKHYIVGMSTNCGCRFQGQKHSCVGRLRVCVPEKCPDDLSIRGRWRAALTSIVCAKMFALCASSAFCFSTQVPIVYASNSALLRQHAFVRFFLHNFFFSLVFHRAILWDPKSEKHKIHQ